MGSQNGSVYLFRVSRDGFSYKKSNKIRGTQPLIQLDWSSDSRFLQTVTQDYDLVFCKSLINLFIYIKEEYYLLTYLTYIYSQSFIYSYYTYIKSVVEISF